VGAEAVGPTCECGRALSPGSGGVPGEHREIACPCRRRCDCALGEKGWALEACLTPERSVPLAGFSRELGERADAERYRFLFPLKDVPLPVHMIFSPSTGRAEVKAADVKTYEFEGVESPTQARRFWIARWVGTGGVRRSRRPVFVVPRRSGRLPRLPAAPPRPSAPAPAG
jgi:hypothetical protein